VKRSRVPTYREIRHEIDARRTPTLEVGCGNDKIAGATGIDIVAGSQADIVHDLNAVPWPLADSSFEVIRLWSILEHLRDPVAVMQEVHRVAKPAATVLIGTPHFSGTDAYTDPSHMHFFSARFIDYFIPGTELSTEYGFYGTARFRLDERRVTLSPFWSRLRLTRVMNAILPIYETYLCYVIRGADIQLKLTVLKE
jgi:SAM-dependent methyltransferase